MFRSGIAAIENLARRWFCQPQLVLAYNPSIPHLTSASTTSFFPPNVFDDLSIWFAVPKQKVSHSKKRMKQAKKNVFPRKENIVFCRHTNQVTLMHKLPFNWRDYLSDFQIGHPGGDQDKS